MTDEVKLVKNFDDLMVAGDREDPAFTSARFVELLRGGDGEPRCALVFAGPEAFRLGNIMLVYMDTLAKHAAEKASGPRPTT